LVRVDNVNLVTAMVTQRQVRAGFIARSALVIAAKRDTVQMDETEILWFSDHEPIHQALVLLDHAQHNPAARFWVEQIDHPAVRELIRADGYQLRPLESVGGG
jgi:ABC-type molybdate transport system substrate-binding protein